MVARKRLPDKIYELGGRGADRKHSLRAGEPFSKKCLGFIST